MCIYFGTKGVVATKCHFGMGATKPINFDYRFLLVLRLNMQNDVPIYLKMVIVAFFSMSYT